MHIVLVAGGELPSTDHARLKTELDDADLVIAADHGLDHCRTLDRWPALLVGDLDSVSAGALALAQEAGVETVRFPPDKDSTDLALAFDVAVERGATSITAIAVFGGRLDHELGTLGLLASQAWSDLDVRAIDGRRCLWVVRASIDLEVPVGTTMSLVPWGQDALGVSTAGLQWTLDNERLPLGTTRGISNVCVSSTQAVSLAAGTVLVITDIGGD